MSEEIEKKYLLRENGKLYLPYVGGYISRVKRTTGCCWTGKGLTDTVPSAWEIVETDVKSSVEDMTLIFPLLSLYSSISDIGLKKSVFRGLFNDLNSDHAASDSVARQIGYGFAVLEQGYLPIESGKDLARKLGMQSGNITEARLRKRETLNGSCAGISSALINIEGRDTYNGYTFTTKSDGTLCREEREVDIDEAIYNNYSSQFIGRVRKMRIKHPTQGLEAEIDFYLDRDLVTAEVECPSIEIAEGLCPIGKDITEDKTYKNKNLAIPL